jgi:hypothetical protein
MQPATSCLSLHANGENASPPLTWVLVADFWNYPMTKKFVSLLDPPTVLQAGEVIDLTHFIVQSPIYGRFLFTEAQAIEVKGSGIIKNCYFEYR